MTTPVKETIGFIGLGFMGHGMAKNIVRNGYELTVMGRSKREALDDLTHSGAVEVKTAADVGARSTIVFLCVTGSKDVEAIVGSESVLVAGLALGAIVVDCSTSDPNSPLALAGELARKDIQRNHFFIGQADKAGLGTLDRAIKGFCA